MNPTATEPATVKQKELKELFNALGRQYLSYHRRVDFKEINETLDCYHRLAVEQHERLRQLETDPQKAKESEFKSIVDSNHSCQKLLKENEEKLHQIIAMGAALQKIRQQNELNRHENKPSTQLGQFFQAAKEWTFGSEFDEMEQKIEAMEKSIARLIPRLEDARKRLERIQRSGHLPIYTEAPASSERSSNAAQNRLEGNAGEAQERLSTWRAAPLPAYRSGNATLRP